MVENNQKPLFETDDPTRVDPDMPARIAEAALRHSTPDEPDSTDRWLEDRGGGGRRETLAADTPPTPKSPRNKSPNRNPYARGDGDPRDGEIHQATVEEAARRPIDLSEAAQKALKKAHGAVRDNQLAQGESPNIVFTRERLRRERKS